MIEPIGLPWYEIAQRRYPDEGELCHRLFAALWKLRVECAILKLQILQ